MRSIKGILFLILPFSVSMAVGSFVYSGAGSSSAGYDELSLESDPRCLAVNPFTDQAVVAGDKPNTVCIIDLNTQEITATIPIGKKPGGIAVDTELNTALVSSKHDDTVTVIDMNTALVLKTIRVGRSPRGIAVDPRARKALVADQEDGTVSVIDLGTYQVARKIRVGDEPVDIAVDPELRLALVVREKSKREESKKVMVIDLDTYEAVGIVHAGREPGAVSINPETHLAAVANKQDDSITVIDLKDGQTATVPVDRGPVDVAVNPLDNRALVLCRADRTLLLVDLDTRTLLERYPVPKNSRAVAVNPFTNVAAVIDAKKDRLTLIQLPNPVPEISSISPEKIPRGAKEARVAILGSGFIRTSAVSPLPSAPSNHPVDFVDNHRLEIILPETFLARAGTYPLVVANPPPQGGASNTVNLWVENPVPALTGLNPAAAEAGTPGLTVTVYGNGFSTTPWSQ